MSASYVSLVLNHSKATGTNKLVLLGIAWHMTDTWGEGAWCGMERLAAYAGVSTRQVMRSIQALELSGELDVDRHNGRSYGGPKTNRYWVMLDCPHDCDKSPWHKRLEDIAPKIRVVDNFDTRDIQGVNR